MKNILTLVVALFCVLVMGWSQGAAAGQTVPTEKSLLWEISGKDLNVPSYLFGTIHIIGREDYFFTPAMEKALKSTKNVTFEIDIEEMTDMSNLFAMVSMISQMYMKDNKTIRDLLTKEEYQQLSEHFQKKGLPLAPFTRVKPMFLSMIAGGEEDMMGLSPEPDSGSSMVSYELQIMEMAKAQQKEIAGLETVEFQMSLFDSIPYDAQAKMLMASIQSEDSGAEGESQLDKMVRLYKSQDIQGMQTIMGDDPDALGGYEELLLQKRNRSWIPLMTKMMSAQPVFFAVGAGHLGGEEGVISLLRKAGYEVRAVME